VLAQHRFDRAEITLREAEDELSRKNFRLTVNRAYYPIFYAMRALLATVSKALKTLWSHLSVQPIFYQDLRLALSPFSLLWT
jgi:uncharacterized protein (UPF0332 family)